MHFYVALVFFGKISGVVRFWQTLYQAQTLHDLFHLPLSIEAFQQFQTLGMQLDALQWEEASDIWVYIWNSNVFSSQKAYVHLIDHLTGSWSLHLSFESLQSKQEESFLLATS